MSTDNINTLAEVAIEVLERYAFLLGGPPGREDGPAVLPEPSWIVTIAFTGPRAGGVGMVVSPGLARQAAANLYDAMPADGGDEQARDAVKELVNIVCGNYLQRMEGGEVVFNFAVPALRVVAREAAREYVKGRPQAALAVEGHPLVLFLES
jgi:CheY-specific phosphatase CheX